MPQFVISVPADLKLDMSEFQKVVGNEVRIVKESHDDLQARKEQL